MKKILLSMLAGIIIGSGGLFAYSSLAGCPCGPHCACAPCDCSK